MTPPTETRNLWPYGIGAALLLFAGGVAALITLAVRHPQELVARDYYEQELRYQDDIDRRTRAGALATGLRVSLDPVAAQILVTFPADHSREGVTGSLRLYRPSEAALDRTVVLAPDAQGTQRLDLAGLLPGLWRLQVDWRAGGRDYTATEKVRVAKGPR